MGLINQRCQDTGCAISPKYDPTPVSPLLWTPEGIDVDRLGPRKPHFVEAYTRMDPSAGQKLQRLNNGLIPEAGFITSADTDEHHGFVSSFPS